VLAVPAVKHTLKFSYLFHNLPEGAIPMKPIRYSVLCVLGMILSFSLLSTVYGATEECMPEGVEKDFAAVDMPATFPSDFPIPQDHYLMSASSGEADDYNPYPFAMVELLAPGDEASVFSFYEKALGESGYRIVMWEKDLGAMGFRVRGDNIDQATISINSYDCRALVGISVSLMP